MTTPNKNVLRFPVERTKPTEPAPTIAWYRCVGGCGALVAAASTLCISCAIADEATP